MHPYETILTWGESQAAMVPVSPCRWLATYGAGVTVSVAGYFAGIGVHHPGVLLGIDDPHTNNFRRSTSMLRELSLSV
jgi:hypothetical protein